jgi:hypothetical protein
VPVFSLPILIDEHGVIDGRLLFNTSMGGVRHRKACIVEVSCKDQKNYILIIEGPTRLAAPILGRIPNPSQDAAADVFLNSLLIPNPIST